MVKKQAQETAVTSLVAKNLEVSIRQAIFDVAQAQKFFKQIFKRKKITYKDALNNKVVIERDKLLNHLAEGQGGIRRVRYLPLVQDMIKNPQVILKDSRLKYPHRYYYFSKYKLATKEQNIAVLGDMEDKKIIIFGLIPFSETQAIKRLKAHKTIYQQEK